jgi:hypothetical protein
MLRSVLFKVFEIAANAIDHVCYQYLLSGAAWHAHFANHLTDLGFLPCRSHLLCMSLTSTARNELTTEKMYIQELLTCHL